MGNALVKMEVNGASRVPLAVKQKREGQDKQQSCYDGTSQPLVPGEGNVS